MIILSQRIDTASKYDDIPFSSYHFPKRYINQIRPGDRFIYYQGDRQKKENRYYFGCGVIGAIDSDETGEFYYAKIIDGLPFSRRVPIYHSGGKGFIENMGYKKVRKMPNPSWQNSIRKISDDAFFEIIRIAGVTPDYGLDSSVLENTDDYLKILLELNNRYEDLTPQERATRIQKQIDRGTAVTRALKALLGARCQVCGWKGFTRKSGGEFIEAHHVTQLSEGIAGSLCTENIILVCPNCHREIHYGKTISVKDFGQYFEIMLSASKATINKNSMEFLSRQHPEPTEP